ncbi:MAG: autotransporter domain-containing protein [Endomicrobia bacterium]|nr:autotransporter domain-containing protein [Endomicrobiia bacterium]
MSKTPLRKVFSLLVAALFLASSAFAGQNIVIDGTVSDNIYGNGTLPNGAEPAGGFPANADGNSVTVSSGAVVIWGYDLFGGYAESASGSAAADGNSVAANIGAKIEGGSLTGGYAYAKGSNSATASGNTITSNIYINGVVVGGRAESDSGDTAANNNIININAGSNGACGGSAFSPSATANNNVVNVSGPMTNDAYGGVAGGGESSSGSVIAMANNNAVNVTGGWGSLRVTGGRAGSDSGTATAMGNSAVITGGTMTHQYVHGGDASTNSGYAITTDNKVVIKSSGSTVGEVAGGYTTTSGGSAAANGNTADIINSMAGGVYGGYTYCDAAVMTTASGNIVNITGSTVGGDVVGGFAGGYNNSFNNSADNNRVIIMDSTVNGNVFGGCVDSDSISDTMTATHNTVTIGGASNLPNATVYGGYINIGTGDARTGNTLNIIYTGTTIQAKSVANFEYYNFYLPSTAQPNNTMLNLSAAANITGSKIGIGFSDGAAPAMAAGDKFTLLNSTVNLASNQSGQTIYAATISKLYEFSLNVNPTSLIAEFTGITRTNPQTKILSEGIAAGAITALQSVDNINGSLLSGLQDGKIEVFGSFFGGSSKYDTGSSVNMSVFGAAAGIGKKFGGNAAALDAGIFVEYASGSFDTEYDSLKGDGTSSAIGGGILVKKDINKKVYVEGLIRAGQLSNDYKTEILDKKADFDYSSTYFGFSLGGGYIFEVSKKVNIDAFGKYILTNVSGGNADIAGDKYEFDAVMSNRVKAGVKGEYKITETIKPYLAAAYDHELSGEANAKIDGMKIEAPTLNGGTFSGELGISAKVASSLTLDLGANIYSGTREGATGSLKAKYEF